MKQVIMDFSEFLINKFCEQEQIYPLVKLCISDLSISQSSLGLSAKFGKKCIQISQRFFKTIHKSELNCIQHIFKVAHLALKILFNSSENDLIMKYNILHTKYTSRQKKTIMQFIIFIGEKHDFLKFDSINMNKSL